MKNRSVMLIVFIVLYYNKKVFAQDTTFIKNKIGGFATASAGSQHSFIPFGDAWLFSSGVNYEREFKFNIPISFMTGFAHTIIIGQWIPDSLDTDLSTRPDLRGKNLTNVEIYESSQREIVQHIRVPIIVIYNFPKHQQSQWSILFGTIPGIFMDKWSRIDRSISGYTKYYQHYKRYGGLDIFAFLAGIEYDRQINEKINMNAQWRFGFETETVQTGFLFGINYTLK